jgi:hypothetical protein
VALTRQRRLPLSKWNAANRLPEFAIARNEDPIDQGYLI